MWLPTISLVRTWGSGSRWSTFCGRLSSRCGWPSSWPSMKLSAKSRTSRGCWPGWAATRNAYEQAKWFGDDITVKWAIGSTRDDPNRTSCNRTGSTSASARRTGWGFAARLCGDLGLQRPSFRAPGLSLVPPNEGSPASSRSPRSSRGNGTRARSAFAWALQGKARHGRWHPLPHQGIDSLVELGRGRLLIRPGRPAAKWRCFTLVG